MRKWISFIVSICMILTMIPTIAFAADNGDVNVDGINSSPVEELTLEDEEVVEETPVEENVASEDVMDYDVRVITPNGEGDGWLQDPATGQWQYIEAGVPVTGFIVIGGATYYFDENGFMLTGLQAIGGSKYYFDPNGDAPGVVGSSLGVMRKGMVKIDGKKYFFSESTGKMKTGWVVYKNYKYFFNTNTGKMKTGWLRADGNKYYLRPNTGRVKTGWLTLTVKKKSSRYYLKPNDNINSKAYGAAAMGLTKIGNYKYCFTTAGVMRKGLITVNKTLYFFSKTNGRGQAKGWFKYNGKTRYSYGYGKLATGTKKISGIWYIFGSSNGVLLRKIGDDVDKSIYNKSSATKYIIVVVKNNHTVRVYSGKKNNWSKQKTWTCTIGKASTPTKSGDYTIYWKEEYQQNTSKTCRWWYCSHFNKQLQFQSVLYDANPIAGKGKLVDGRLGVSVSDGAVRLKLENAKWIYDNAPNGTKVVVE